MLRDIIKPFLGLSESTPSTIEPQPKETKTMKIAIPTVDGKLNMHFGHCAAFTLLDVDTDSKTITATTELEAPPHEPGLLPPWLAERGVNMIIAGGMGQRAQSLFTAQNIDVIVGAPSEPPETLVMAYLAGALETGTNACDH